MRFENDGAFHFDFYLAEKLHRTVAEIHQMDQDEWHAWSIYYGRKKQQQELARR